MGIHSGLTRKASCQVQIHLKDRPKIESFTDYKVFAHPTSKTLVMQKDSVTCYFHVHLTRHMEADILLKIADTNS